MEHRRRQDALLDQGPSPTGDDHADTLGWNPDSIPEPDGQQEGEADERQENDEDADRPTEGGGVVEHEEDGREELQEGRHRQQPEASEPE